MAGDFLASFGPGIPVYWDTFVSDLADAEAREAALLSSAPSNAIAPRGIPLLGAASLPLVQNGDGDDEFVEVILPFPIRYLGASYSAIYVGSNSYATFTAGATVYSGIGAANPALPGIHISAADNSYQRVYAGAENGGTTFRIRYEGHNHYNGGVIGSPTIVWEMTFTQATPSIIELSIGTNARSPGGTSGCTDGTTYVLTIPAANADTGYVITSV
jgi:hypothetical protein